MPARVRNGAICATLSILACIAALHVGDVINQLMIGSL